MYDSATQSFSREWSGVSVALSMTNETAELLPERSSAVSFLSSVELYIALRVQSVARRRRSRRVGLAAVNRLAMQRCPPLQLPR